MNSFEATPVLPPSQAPEAAVRGATAASIRVLVYVGCTALALAISYLLGKDMGWDTLDYHFYAGFTALHDRFNQDYFAAGSQSYFNPYVYAPFYLLAASGLPALAVASILAAVQSIILWLSYELALEVMPVDKPRARIAMATCAVMWALANPILINQFGSSFADITTAEFVVAGWLLLIRAIRAPGVASMLCAGVLLGVATALKPTNALHALSALVVVLFLPVRWPVKLRRGAEFGIALAASFAAVCLPWSIRLEHYFGNPFFPLLNGVFRSPQFPVTPMMDHRFMPDSLAAALWRPFALALPLRMEDDELASPDLRYALLLVAAALMLLWWLWRRFRRNAVEPEPSRDVPRADRALAALGCGFAIDWTLWLSASGNGRYFIAMACIAAVIGVALVFRLFAARPKLCAYVIASVFSAQALQLYSGTQYHFHAPWKNRPWFDISVPKKLASEPDLYFVFGVQTNSFVYPFLAARSGFINISGDYELAPARANGARIAALIRRYSPHLMMLVQDARFDADQKNDAPESSAMNDALEPFGLRLDGRECSKIAVTGGSPPSVIIYTKSDEPTAAAQSIPSAASTTDYFSACGVVPVTAVDATRAATERKADLVLDRLEDSCPSLFQPRRPVTQYFGDLRHGAVWARRYPNTSLTVWVSHGWIKFTDPLRGGPATYIGRIADWEAAPQKLECGRRHGVYFAKQISSISAQRWR
ncbi:MAG TPA: hypothetical protein VF730_09575 [Terracidiphilus sp.]